MESNSTFLLYITPCKQKIVFEEIVFFNLKIICMLIEVACELDTNNIFHWAVFIAYFGKLNITLVFITKSSILSVKAAWHEITQVVTINT